MEIENHSDDFTKAKPEDTLLDNFSISEKLCLETRDVMNTKVVTISPEETVAVACRIMAEKNISCIVVTDNKNVIGIFTERDLLKKVVAKKRDFAAVRIAEVMSSPVVWIPSKMSVFEASKIMGKKNIKRLPVIENEQLVGIITQTDMIRALTSSGLWRSVEDVMNRNVAVFPKNKMVVEAAKVMASHNISCVVVIEKNEVVGILSERDFIKKIAALQKDPSCTKIEEVMTSPVKSVPPDCSVFHANWIMQQMNIRKLVVMKDKKLCGIITQTDLFYEAKKNLQKEEEENLKLWERSDNSIFVVDLNGKITFVNRALLKLLEISKPELLINQPFLPVQFLSEPKKEIQLLKELVIGGGITVKNLTLNTLKGKKISVILFKAFTKDSHGEINGGWGVLYDLTDKRG